MYFFYLNFKNRFSFLKKNKKTFLVKRKQHQEHYSTVYVCMYASNTIWVFAPARVGLYKRFLHQIQQVLFSIDLRSWSNSYLLTVTFGPSTCFFSYLVFNFHSKSRVSVWTMVHSFCVVALVDGGLSSSKISCKDFCCQLLRNLPKTLRYVF